MGEVKGLKGHEGTVQYLGIQYATLKDRFAAPALKEYQSGAALDGTKLG